jgi:hypothetical protein
MAALHFWWTTPRQNTNRRLPLSIESHDGDQGLHLAEYQRVEIGGAERVVRHFAPTKGGGMNELFNATEAPPAAARPASGVLFHHGSV